MKTIIRIANTALIAISACSLTFAQETTLDASQRDQQQSEQQQSEQQQNQQQPEQAGQQDQVSDFQPHRSSDFEGSRVVNPQGDRLGTLRDLLLNMENGTFSYAIIAAGGFLGVGADWKPVPVETLQIRSVDSGLEFVLDMTEEEWKRAPSIDRKKIDDLAIETRSQEIYDFYGADWQTRQQQIGEYGSSAARPDQQQQPDETATSEDRQSQSVGRQSGRNVGEIEAQIEQAMTEAGAEQQKAKSEANRLARDLAAESSVGEREIRRRIEQAMLEADIEQEQAQNRSEQLAGEIAQNLQENQSHLYLSSELRNTPIINEQLDEVGEITDFIIDASRGQIAFVLFAEETGILQSVDQEYAIAPNAFQAIADDQVQLDVREADLREAPRLTAAEMENQAREFAQMNKEEASHQPQVFRFSDDQISPGVYGSPDRETSPERERPRTPRERNRDDDVRQMEKHEHSLPRN